LSVFENEKKDDFKDFKEPLNLLTTTPKNFTRFVSRLGPIVEGQAQVIKVLGWEEPGKSSAVLLLYILVCLYPWLVMFFPTFFIFYILFRKTPSESQSQYMKNMQFIQNHMKMGSDLFDYINESLESLRKSKDANLILLYSFLGSTAASIGLYYIPIKLNWIFLIIGVPALTSHTVTFRYFSFLFKKIFFSLKKELLSSKIRNPNLKSGENDKLVKVFENQRWWAGLGWIPFLLKNERPGWSDESGTISFSHINDYEPLDFYKWKEDEWSIYTDWSEVGVDRQGILYLVNI
jgi:hypothetical protein